MRFSLWLVACVASSACSDPTEPTSGIHWLTMEPTSLSLVAGESGQLAAVGRDIQLATIPDVIAEWSTSNASVAVVSDNGTVTAIGKGSASIVATARGRTATAAITVRWPANQLQLSAANLEVLLGQPRNVTLSATDATNGSIPNVNPTWASSDSSVAVVTGVGMLATVTGLTAGSATITASADGKTVSLQVLTGPPASVAGTWDWTEQIMEPGSSWVCTDTGSVAISQSGTVLVGPWDQAGECANGAARALNTKSGSLTNGSVGLTQIQFSVFANGSTCTYTGSVDAERTSMAGTATCNSSTGTWRAVRALPITAIGIIQVAAPFGGVLLGETQTLRVDLTNSAGHRAFRPGVVWTSSDNQVATIVPSASQAALFRAVGAGTATISAALESASSSVQIDVGTLEFSAVSAGATNTCATTPDGSVYCWTTRPQRRFTGPQLSLLAVGTTMGCGLDATGAAHCWLESLDTPDDEPISAVPTNLRFSTISVGGWIEYDYYYYYQGVPRPHACATTADGVAYCWGDDVFGQLGDGRTGSPVETPLAVATSLRFSSISAGRTHTCAIATTAGSYCWGDNAYGQLGTGTTERSLVPIEVTSTVAFASIYSGGYHTCALTATGTAWCWGSNQGGRLGVSGQGNQLTPVEVSGGLAFTTLAMGNGHSCGLTTAGDAYCWGANSVGQLGVGLAPTVASTPQRVMGSSKFTMLTTGADGAHTCGYTTDQRVYCWGASWLTGAGAFASAGPNKVTGQR